MNRYFWVINVLYTEGLLTGLTVKTVIIHKFCKYIPVFSIPFLPTSYNRKRGLEFRAMERYYKNFREENEG